MVKLDTFYIEYDQEWSVYGPGQTLTGKVFIKNSEKIYADEITAQVQGQGRVFWVEQEMKPPNGMQNVGYASDRTFFESSSLLWTPKGGKRVSPKVEQEEKEAAVETILKEASSFGIKGSAARLIANDQNRSFLPEGTHEFRFEARLPNNLPTSFESSSAPAWIRYSVKVCILEGKRSKHHRKEHFTVIRPTPLNPNSARPVVKHTSAQMKTNSLCCVSGDGGLGLMVSLQKCGLVPGEPIPVAVELDNHGGSASVELKLRLRLQQQVTAYAEKPEHRMKEYRSDIVSTGAQQKMEAAYCVVVDVVAPGRVKPLISLSVPVLVGTTPVHPALFTEKPENPSPPPAYDGPPPTYSESVMGRSAIDTADYVPHYPTYDTANLIAHPIN